MRVRVRLRQMPSLAAANLNGWLGVRSPLWPSDHRPRVDATGKPAAADEKTQSNERRARLRN